jgi:16S rRNA G966 N2-methylase RsmD
MILGDSLQVMASLTEREGLRGKVQCIYFDPPYESPLYQPVLEAIAGYQLLAPGGEIAVEHRSKQWQPVTIDPLVVSRTKVYGNTALTFYHPYIDRRGCDVN